MNKKQLEAKREEIKQKVYDIVLAARTEGIICGKTKQFSDGDAEDILSQLSSLGVMLVDKEAELPLKRIEKETIQELVKPFTDDYGKTYSVSRYNRVAQRQLETDAESTTGYQLTYPLMEVSK